MQNVREFLKFNPAKLLRKREGTFKFAPGFEKLKKPRLPKNPECSSWENSKRGSLGKKFQREKRPQNGGNKNLERVFLTKWPGKNKRVYQSPKHKYAQN